MFGYFKTSTIMIKTLGLPILFLLIFLVASFLTMNASAASVYQCSTHNGKVIFTDSPAQLHECQELTFYMSEEQVKGKTPQPQRDNWPDRESAEPQGLAMINEDLFNSSSHVVGDEALSDSHFNDFADDEYSDEE